MNSNRGEGGLENVIMRSSIKVGRWRQREGSRAAVPGGGGDWTAATGMCRWQPYYLIVRSGVGWGEVGSGRAGRGGAGSGRFGWGGVGWGGVGWGRVGSGRVGWGGVGNGRHRLAGLWVSGV